MPGERFQAMLFEHPDEEGHWFYIATDMSSVKAGYSRNTVRRMRDLHATLVGKIRCFCGLPRENRRPTCVLETRWEHTHSRARLPESEWYRPTSGVLTGLRFMFGIDDRSMAIIDQLERNHRQAAG
jgi:hypothetical protein